MIALTTIVICFFVLVIIYPAAVALLVLAGHVKKRRVIRDGDAGPTTDQIDNAVDKLKNRIFIISIVIAFFVIAPFLALLMVL
jgi:multisubunit Na+/H+ antiporter MnhC subunit